MKLSSRRRFLKGGALAGAAALVAPGELAGAQGTLSGRSRERSADLASGNDRGGDCSPGRRAGARRQRALRVGLHGRRHQVTRVRVHLRESGFELPRAALSRSRRCARTRWRSRRRWRRWSSCSTASCRKDPVSASVKLPIPRATAASSTAAESPVDGEGIRRHRRRPRARSRRLLGPRSTR